MAFTTISADDWRLKRNTQEATIINQAEKIKEAAKCKSPIEFHPLPKDDPKRRCPDTSKLERLVGWKPNVSFEEETRESNNVVCVKKTQLIDAAEKNGKIRVNCLILTMQSPHFPYQFLRVQITRSRKQLANSTLNILGHLRKSGGATTNDYSDQVVGKYGLKASTRLGLGILRSNAIAKMTATKTTSENKASSFF